MIPANFFPSGEYNNIRSTKTGELVAAFRPTSSLITFMCPIPIFTRGGG